MWFLFLQIWIWLILAFVLGWFAHWFFCCRNKGNHDQASSDTTVTEDTSVNLNASSTASTAAASNFQMDVADADQVPVSEDWKPMLFASAPDQVDDLKQIKGVGQVLQDKLHNLGVYQFQQIADWTDEHVAWMDNFLSFTGRIDREEWRQQAKILAAGGTTEFAQRVEKGDVEY